MAAVVICVWSLSAAGSCRATPSVIVTVLLRVRGCTADRRAEWCQTVPVLLTQLFFFGLFVVALMVVSGCANNGVPTKYTQQVEANHMETCNEGATLTAMNATDAAAYCVCTYRKLEEQIPFRRFRDYEDFLRANAGDSVNTIDDLAAPGRYPDIVTLMRSCSPVGPIPSSDGSGNSAITR